WPLWVAIPLGLVGMMGLGYLVERLVLQHMIGRPVVTIIMATIGLASFLQGLAPFALGGIATKNVPLPINDDPIFVCELLGIEGATWCDVILNRMELYAAGSALIGFGLIGWFFIKSRSGIAMRAIADDQQVSLAMGIDVKRYFALAWVISGMVALVGGIVWGNAIGVDVQMALIGLKVFPVVILGGLDSILGAIIGGLVIGVVEAVAAGFIDPLVGGGTKDFVPYLLLIVVLMVRPYGLFGKEIIERV
ncbi:MAG: branched-chain amino acid ABC transporter permease, partial [SAR324 cluster bacterium]|nr:branched-chain amino acid ABC transporter permease [SAR324 cluster bacterium]